MWTALMSFWSKLHYFFGLVCAAQSSHVPFLHLCYSPMIVHFRNLFLFSTPIGRMFLTRRWVGRRKDVKKVSINISELKVEVKHSISSRIAFSHNPHLVEEATWFPFFAPWYGLNCTTESCLTNKYPDFIFLLNWLAVCSLTTAMTSITGNHTMDLLYLLKENFKNLIFFSREGASRICLIYQVACCHKDGDSERCTWTYNDKLNQTLPAQKYQGSSPNKLYGLEAYGTH